MTAVANKRLIELERIVSKGMANFVEVGNALMAIRDEFKGEFPSLGYKDFEDYCRSKWDANIARYFDLLERNKQIKAWFYEPQTFWFEKIRRGVRSLRDMM